MPSRNAVIAGLAGVLLGGGAMALISSGGAFSERGQVEQVVRAYILANPEIIPEAMGRLQDKQFASVVQQNRAAFETPFASAWAGAEQGDVVLVEFFDYACGFCRKSNDDIDRLLAEDKKLKVVWRELPVLGPDSQAAAEASLAAARQGRFRQFYDGLFEKGRPVPNAVQQVQAEVGVRPMPKSPEFAAELDKNFQLARAINATGTPTFVVGDKVLQGAVGYDALKQAIAQARARG
jgi:protein-disulfide isomerase